MLAGLPSTAEVARRWSPWSIPLVTAVATLPLVIATLALVPALLVCPFLPMRHQRLALRLLALLRKWSNTIVYIARPPP